MSCKDRNANPTGSRDPSRAPDLGDTAQMKRWSSSSSVENRSSWKSFDASEASFDPDQYENDPASDDRTHQMQGSEYWYNRDRNSSVPVLEKTARTELNDECCLDPDNDAFDSNNEDGPLRLQGQGCINNRGITTDPYRRVSSNLHCDTSSLSLLCTHSSGLAGEVHRLAQAHRAWMLSGEVDEPEDQENSFETHLPAFVFHYPIPADLGELLGREEATLRAGGEVAAALVRTAAAGLTVGFCSRA